MASFNHFVLAGNLVRDPEPGATQGGTSKTTFALAVNEYTKQGERTSYFDVIGYGSVADRVNRYLTKGSGVIIGGRVQQQRWESEDGQKRARVVFIANELQFQVKSGGKKGGDEASEAQDGEDADIPF